MRMTGTTKLHPDMSRKEAVRAFHAMRDELVIAEERIKYLETRVKDLERQLQESKEDR